MADIYIHEPIQSSLLDPNTVVTHWRSLEGREKNQNEINLERMERWRKKYDARISINNWRKYHQQSEEA